MPPALAEYSGAFSPSGEGASPSQALWEAARDLYTQTESPILSQWLAQGELPPAEVIIDNKLHEQRVWAAQNHLRIKQDLFDIVSLRGKVRLHSEGQQHAGAWLSVPPNTNLEFRFGTGEFLLLIHFHLGLPILPAAAAGTPWASCSVPVDVFGDQLVACRESGAWERHNKLCSTLSAIATSAGLSVRTEVQIQGKRRPADLLIGHWANGRDAAVDPTIIHCLNPSHAWDWRQPAVYRAESAIHEHSDAVCAAAGLSFLPVGADTFGAFGQEGHRFLGQLFSRYAKHLTFHEVSFPGKLSHKC